MQEVGGGRRWAGAESEVPDGPQIEIISQVEIVAIENLLILLTKWGVTS